MIEPTYEDLRRFSRANEHYRRQYDHGGDITAELIGFYQWMRERWGIEIHRGGHQVPPQYWVTDRHQYLLFLLRYSQ
jgi:hypothetical protein